MKANQKYLQDGQILEENARLSFTSARYYQDYLKLFLPVTVEFEHNFNLPTTQRESLLASSHAWTHTSKGIRNQKDLKVLSSRVLQNHFHPAAENYAVGKAEDITHCRRWLHVLMQCNSSYKSHGFQKTMKQKLKTHPFLVPWPE